MHIRKLRIQDIRSIRNLEIDIPEPCAGWHVILGDNGSGKSSLIRSLALALMGPADAVATRQDWQDWIRKSASKARVELEVTPEARFDKWKRTGRRAKAPIKVSVEFQAPSDTVKEGAIAPHIAGRYADRTIWGGGVGWFSASSGHSGVFPEATRNTTDFFTAIRVWRAIFPLSAKTWRLAKP